MSTIGLVALTADTAREASTWFVGDEEGQRRFGGFYGDHPRWWDLVRTDEGRHGWVAHVEDEPIGFIDIEVKPDVAHLAFYVRRERRRQGLGVAVVQAAMAEARKLGVMRLSAGIEPDNRASLACCRSAGFTDAGTNEYGDRVLLCDLS